MIVIYTPKVTNRIKFVFDFVFEQYFGIPYSFTTLKPEGPKNGETLLVYDSQKHEGHFCIFRDNLLLEEYITAQRIFVSRESDLPVFFQSDKHFTISFDIFSCIFYLITRYEEYLPYSEDDYGRYPSANSILANKEFNFRPIVEEWLIVFKNKLLEQFPHLVFKEQCFCYIPTFDVDAPFRFLGRNFIKHPPNIFAKNALSVLVKKQGDPYGIFDTLFKEVDALALKPIFFFLLNDDGEKNSKVSPHYSGLHQLIHTIKNRNYRLGIHPSFDALFTTSISEEKEKLEFISGEKISRSRQHFLKINFPNYYVALEKAGIEEDYSLAYPDRMGCRAGTTQAFYFFNLKENKSTTLKIIPSVLMDACFEYYQSTKKIEEIEKEIFDFLVQLKKINAILVTIYHNDLLATNKYSRLWMFINQNASKL